MTGVVEPAPEHRAANQIAVASWPFFTNDTRLNQDLERAAGLLWIAEPMKEIFACGAGRRCNEVVGATVGIAKTQRPAPKVGALAEVVVNNRLKRLRGGPGQIAIDCIDQLVHQVFREKRMASRLGDDRRDDGRFAVDSRGPHHEFRGFISREKTERLHVDGDVRER